MKLNLDCLEVSEKEKQKLRNLLDRFGDLFVSENGQLGRTSAVKHSITTSGRPIRPKDAPSDQNRRANPVPKQTDVRRLERQNPKKILVLKILQCMQNLDADDEPDADNVQMACPQRNRRPPDRYGTDLC